MTPQPFEPEEIPPEELTWREQEVLAFLGERLTNREIANRLHLAESTVKDYVGRILGKLHAKNRRQAVARAEALGLFGSEEQAYVEQRHNLPAEITPFIGRAAELLEINRLITQTRLLTLIGPGGIGKSRLALQAASGAMADFEHGVYFVSLAPLDGPEHILQTVAEALDFPLFTKADPLVELQGYLRRRAMLIVMDNFEHLLAGAELVSEILQGAPAVKILATSREKLGLRGETTLAVEGMTSQAPEDNDKVVQPDAVALFLQSARRVRPNFEPDANEMLHTARICEMLGGMPLAIELAAGWLHMLSVADIDAELQKGLDILTTEDRDVPQRHRSIRAVFEHSWSLMGQEEQMILMALSVFRGGFTREAAQEVTSAILPALASLANKSFLQHDSAAGRYAIHEVLRQQAQGFLESMPDAGVSANEAHAVYFAEFMRQRWQYLKDERQFAALWEIDADIENIRKAWRYWVSRKHVGRMRMFFDGIRLVYWVRGWNRSAVDLFKEAEGTLAEVQGDTDAAALRALAVANQGFFMAWLGLAEKGYLLAKESIQVLQGLGYPQDLAHAYDSLSLNSYYLLKNAEELEAARAVVQIAEEVGDQWRLGYGLFLMSVALLRTRADEEVRQLAESSLRIKNEIGDELGAIWPLLSLGHVALAQKDFAAARNFFLQSLRIAERVGYRWAIGNSSKYLGHVALLLGDFKEAEAYFLRNLRIAEEIGLGRDIVNLLYDLARLRVAEGRLEQAVGLLAMALKQPASEQARLGSGPIKDNVDALLSELRQELSEKRYNTALRNGQDLELDDWVASMIAAPR